jgi:high-affinity nickel-transport protein
VSDGRRPLTVGLWFSLGHSTVVFLLCILLTVGVKTLISQVGDPGSALQSVATVIGTTVSGTFLVIVGILNLVVLTKIIRMSGRLRRGMLDHAELDDQLTKRGGLIRLIGRALQVVRRPWQIYPVGFLFGLGFDTATEISLLVLAGGAAAVSLPWYVILTLPVLFTAGMSLMDSVDGVLMHLAYGWAREQPARRIYYNIVVTAVSVAVSLLIGGIELTGLLAERLGIDDGPLGAIASVDLNNVGFYIVGLLLSTWLIALLVWKFGRIEQRWS